MSVDPITCHILDTSRGKPASGVTCQIYHIAPLIDNPEDESAYEIGQGKPFAMNRTDQDGRIKKWVLDPNLSTDDKNYLGVTGSGSEVQWADLKPGIYKVKFLTGKYFHTLGASEPLALASRTFFPFVDIIFQVKNPPDAHYHIPLLLSNHSYTTYRGS
ncbi:Hydroxyisourate hydrolase [Suhomyces tanzawaensis NRRL Y-17324]|uniref:5-hydroxyisourate hydrolase n=1 Tax=Suhomyces tanzawaensis NRRL Y-17324 TaxID=984487 RepID=A0A1E4SNP7_9ASCO|nr:Hydroxyisourate hydrolase [Suhomyces tanzawaensis NRRL Y-17324]ODV81150.1 Hydroxyisourate hydrolase [Suhomyces tanzawaensis NRRL Y-17324]